MSLETWKKEYYPVAAKECAANGDTLACLDHSIKKWEGARAADCKRHGVLYEMSAISETRFHGVERVEVPFYSETCALCVKFYMSSVREGEKCRLCPIYKATGDDCNLEFSSSDNGPKDMLRLLRRTRRWLVGWIEKSEEKARRVSPPGQLARP